jgi:hypothetical protein
LVSPPDHATLNHFAASSNGRKWTVHALLDARMHTHMWDHRVMGRALLPGAGFLEAGIAAATIALPVDVASAADVALLDCSVPVPMILPDPSKDLPPPPAKGNRGGKSSSSRSAPAASKVVGLEWCVEHGSPHLEIASLSSHPLSSRPPHAGAKRSTPAHLRARLSLVVQRDSVTAAVDADDTVSARQSRRRNIALLLYASTPPTTTPSSGGIRAAVGVIAAPCQDEYMGYHVHPACVDNSMQLAAALASKDGRSKVMVPAGIKSFSAPTRAPRAHFFAGTADVAPPPEAKGDDNPGSAASQESSHRLLNGLGGGVLAQLNNLEVKEMRRAPAAPAAGQPRPAAAAAAAATPLRKVMKGAAKVVPPPEEPLPPRVTYAIEWLARTPSAVLSTRDPGGDGTGAYGGAPPMMMLPEARGGGGGDSSSSPFSLPRRGRAQPTAVVALLQNHGGGNAVDRALVRTLGGAVSTDGATPFASSSSSSTATAAAMHGMARTAAQECRKTQLDSIDLDASSSTHAADDPFDGDQITLGAAREGTSRGMQLRVPHLHPSPHVAKRAQPSPLKMQVGQALPPGKIAVRVRATSVSFSDALRSAFFDETATATEGGSFVGFAGTVMDSGVFSPGEVGTAVFGVLSPQREYGAAVGSIGPNEPPTSSSMTTTSSSSSIQVIDAAMCRPKPDGLTFEEAAVLPGPHIAAHACLAAIRSALSPPKEEEEIVILLQGYPSCPVAAALACLLDHRSTDRVRWIPAGAGADAADDCSCALPPGVTAVAAVVGRFDAPGAVAAALKVVRRGGVLVKTSTSSGAAASTWCTETVRSVMSGVGPVAGSFLRDAAAADPFVARPDVTFCADAVTAASLARGAPAALTELARAIAEEGGSSRRMVSIPSVAAPPSDATMMMNASLARYAMGTFSNQRALASSSSSSSPALDAVNAHHAPTPGVAQRPKPVLITGGLGAIGIEISLWLAQHYPVRVHLLGRSGRRSPAGGTAPPDALGAHAGVVTIHRSDASFAEECSSVAEILRSTASSFNQQDALGAVLHASGKAGAGGKGGRNKLMNEPGIVFL